MDIASYIANSQTTPASAELGTAQLQLVTIIIIDICKIKQDTIMIN